VNEAYDSNEKTVIIELGLIVGKDARGRRGILSRKMRIGHSNDEQLLQKINAFGYSETDVR
ncbi:DUF4093 domain-containing protein, partial [Staphylococcus aureus]